MIIKELVYICTDCSPFIINVMGQEHPFDRFSQQALQALHRYRAVMFSPPSVSKFPQIADTSQHAINQSIIFTDIYFGM